MTDWKTLHLKLHSLVLFRKLLACAPMRSLLRLLEATSGQNTFALVEAYAAFYHALTEENINLSAYVRDIALADSNLYVQHVAQGKEIPTELEECLSNELSILQEVAGLSSPKLKRVIPYEGFLPSWQNDDVDLATIYREYLSNIPTHGYGLFATYYMFTCEDGALSPVRYPDTTRLSNLRGYNYERDSVIKNTLALLEGRPAANALLYGDSGTGKSSTVKAITNEYHNRGLRLVEIRKNQLLYIPVIIDSLCSNPLKFILFIDDLSFECDDDNYSILKATLEGSVLARAKNIAIYATSNRRHLVRESFSERSDDDVHANETVQQLISLSDRFGLTVPFLIPKKEEYLQIVAHIAKIYHVDMAEKELFRQAEVYALQKGGRSPRIAKQFIEQLAAES